MLHRNRFAVFTMAVGAVALLGCEAVRPFSVIGGDAGASDAGESSDATYDAAPYPLGRVTGGPCLSGANGSTAFRVLWTDDKGTPIPKTEKLGLPDPSHFSASTFTGPGGKTPEYDDPYFGGGVAIDSTNGVDIALSTRGLPHVRSARLAVLARSFDTSTSGSFEWRTNMAVGTTPAGGISNGSPYEWTTADITAALSPDTADELIRITPGPPSLSLVIARVELCLDTDEP